MIASPKLVPMLPLLLLLAGCPTRLRERGDDGGGGDGKTEAATWCTEQTVPAGVAAGDYACADFDDGKVPSGSGWSTLLANGGTGTITTQHASSLPDGWSVSAGTSDQSQAALDWHVAGASPLATVTVAADLSPITGAFATWTGSVSLLCIRAGSNTACIDYTSNQDTNFASNYTGYFLSNEYDGVGVALTQTQLYGTLQPNLWTRVQLQVTASSKTVTATIPGSSNDPVVVPLDPDTTADILVGPQTSGTTPGWAGYVDNIVASVTRSK